MSAEINDGGPAFPMAGSTREWDDVKKQWKPQDGMTLRDWFAGQALGHVAVYSLSNEWSSRGGPEWRNEAAREAYRFADAMIAAREEKP